MEKEFSLSKPIIKSQKKMGLGKYNIYLKKQARMETITGWSFMSPLILVASIFVSVAVVLAIYLTFFSGPSVKNLTFVGLGNWKNIFASEDFKIAVKNTFWYASISTSLTLVGSLLLSIVINTSRIKGKRFFMAIFFLPQLTSGMAITIIFSQLISKDGLIKINWFEDESKIMWVVIIASVWGGIFGGIITYNTAFAGMDRTQYEAAALDGASPIRKTLSITLPSLSPIIAYSLMMGIIGGLGVFDGPWIMGSIANKNSPELYTIAYLGFRWILGAQGGGTIPTNIGYGTVLLLFLGFLMASLSFVSNMIVPIGRRTY